MREIFTYGSVGRAPGNRCLYPETDALNRAGDLQRWVKEMIDEILNKISPEEALEILGRLAKKDSE
jgi:hypothetical protein